MNSYHFIAIGGAIMHNLALALAKKGHQVSGSDDEIYEPSRSRLEKAGILPDKFGWYPEKIHEDLDGIILGMHARIDNPELIKAKELGIPIYSFPEFVFNQSQDKKRVVIAGSHGKTSITSI
ncbi:MAG: Mur ligase domain-containing protein, partial [Cyclobacteriaceae bacterium]|nr:Mur ligase domain-containing protein [Cyclobacteriaceae bacterium]